MPYEVNVLVGPSPCFYMGLPTTLSAFSVVTGDFIQGILSKTASCVRDPRNPPFVFTKDSASPNI